MKNYLARQVWRSSAIPLFFVILLWLVFLIQNQSGSRLLFLGVVPRTVDGIPGIITSVFIHGDIGHISSNSLPLLVLGTMMFYFYRRIALSACLWIWIVSGLWLWVGGRSSAQQPMYHIGASTLIYGLASFLFFSGIFRRHTQLMVVSLLVVFLYGSITWGIFPLKPGMSWEGHLFGAIAGLLVSYNYRQEGPQRKIYSWELDADEELEEQRHDGQPPDTAIPEPDDKTPIG